ncbi:hypothetical protein SAMN02745245_00705 [Anaerosphaera aminiphila DSM 21120]|uniref:Uncharacterized protein n=1 Tax=Anaerosphaera aminiphila DSM 21120 TaxID=1120995 RepID=A0A1M5QRD8_9FIRM|nr:hypothetical protein [Anaerosphaera aminiphila]SHH16441.1 hypothetical protein SAMN02745245_00705 [Anaerosphaera aminiphila DSM 21120]
MKGNTIKAIILFFVNMVLFLAHSKLSLYAKEYSSINFNLNAVMFVNFLSCILIILTAIILYKVNENLNVKSLIFATIVTGIFLILTFPILLFPYELYGLNIFTQFIFQNDYIVKLISLYFGYFLISYLHSKKSVK